jgi:hypothetical protein
MQQITGQCEQFQIATVDTIASAFLRDILGLHAEDCFLSDESDLDDFSLMAGSLDTGERSWDEYVIDKIHAQYGITLKTTRVNLVSLFYQIEQASNVVYH